MGISYFVFCFKNTCLNRFFELLIRNTPTLCSPYFSKYVRHEVTKLGTPFFFDFKSPSLSSDKISELELVKFLINSLTGVVDVESQECDR